MDSSCQEMSVRFLTLVFLLTPYFSGRQEDELELLLVCMIWLVLLSRIETRNCRLWVQNTESLYWKEYMKCFPSQHFQLPLFSVSKDIANQQLKARKQNISSATYESNNCWSSNSVLVEHMEFGSFPSSADVWQELR